MLVIILYPSNQVHEMNFEKFEALKEKFVFEGRNNNWKIIFICLALLGQVWNFVNGPGGMYALIQVSLTCLFIFWYIFDKSALNVLLIISIIGFVIFTLLGSKELFNPAVVASMVNLIVFYALFQNNRNWIKLRTKEKHLF